MVFLATENGSVVSGLDAQLPPSPNAHYIIVSEAAENFKFQSLDFRFTKYICFVELPWQLFRGLAISMYYTNILQWKLSQLYVAVKISPHH